MLLGAKLSSRHFYQMPTIHVANKVIDHKGTFSILKALSQITIINNKIIQLSNDNQRCKRHLNQMKTM